jgi:hypothetical protein
MSFLELVIFVVTLAPGAVNLATSLVTYARTDARRIQEQYVQNFIRKPQRYVGCNRRILLKCILEEIGRCVCGSGLLAGGHLYTG